MAAVWVVLCHFGGLCIALLPILQPLQRAFSLGYFAVPLFFLLSGFILSHNYFPSYSINAYPRFLFLRFARLWPVHFVTLVLMLIYTGATNYSLGRLAEELLMVHSWFLPDLGLNYPAWSISAEWFAYICVFPLAFLTLKPIRSVPLLLGILIALLSAASWMPQRLILGRGGDIVFLFSAGATLYRIRALKPSAAAEWIQNVGLFLVLTYVFFGGMLPRIVIYAGFAGLVFGLSYQRGFLSSILSTRYMVLGGAASYSLYMTHAVVGTVYGLFTTDMKPQPVLVRLLLLGLLAMGLGGAAMALYRYIEEPANKALRRLALRPKYRQSSLSPATQPTA